MADEYKTIISGIGNLVLMYVGISSVINNDLTLGSYMAFMTLAGYFTDSVSNLVGLQLQIQEANISMKRLSEIMDYEREQELSIAEDSGIPSLVGRGENLVDAQQYQMLEKVDGDIEVNNVTFRYGNRKPALDGVSFIIPKGHKVVGTYD